MLQILMKLSPSVWRSQSESPGRLMIGSLLTFWRFSIVVCTVMKVMVDIALDIYFPQKWQLFFNVGG